MKSQNLFFAKNKKPIINLSSADSAQRVVNIKCQVSKVQHNGVQSTLVISNSEGLSEIPRDNRTSTYQICRIEEKIIRFTTFNKYICN